MESTLLCWAEDQNLKQVREIGQNIVEKAKSILSKYDQQMGRQTKFAGSNGWLGKYMMRNSLKWDHPPNRTSNKVAFLDTTEVSSVNQFLEELASIVARENYSLDQIFALDEFGFQWNNLPCHEDTSSRVTLLLGDSINILINVRFN